MRGFWPARPDPFELFASFPSAGFSSQHVFTQAPGLSEAEVLERLGLKIALVSSSPEIPATLLLEVWKQVGSQGATAMDILARRPGTAPALMVRSLLWLAKLGLVRIGAT
jgi:alpha-maltose-1-phosphate synthase